jgi:sarcosine oxidase subunit beta
MVFGLGNSKPPVERMWRCHPLKTTYDVVIIGAGVHGLAIAYYLAKRGITNVAVLDKGYLGGGASGRNTAIIRSNYRTAQGVAFYDESVAYENWRELDTTDTSAGI